MRACHYRIETAAERLGISAETLTGRSWFLKLQDSYLIDISLMKLRLIDAAWLHGGKDPAGMARFMDMGMMRLVTLLRTEGRSRFDFLEGGSFVHKPMFELSTSLLGDPWPKSANGRHIKGYQNAVLQMMLDEAQSSLVKSKGDLVIAAFHLNMPPKELKVVLEHHGYIVQNETFRRP